VPSAPISSGHTVGQTAPDEFALLLSAAKGGDEESFAAIWRRFQPGLLRYVRVMAGGEAEDLTSDTWLQVTRKLLEFEGDEIAFRAWLYTIVRNRHIDWRRRASRRNESSMEFEVLDRHAGVEDPVAVVETKMSTDSALALVATLPPDQAEAVMLRAVAGLPVAVAAEIMGRPPGTVRVLCHRGLRRLEQNLRAASAKDPNQSSGVGV
jgi:RNA polymerase sigma-70 factor (ECF subfamily)